MVEDEESDAVGGGTGRDWQCLTCHKEPAEPTEIGTYMSSAYPAHMCMLVALPSVTLPTTCCCSWKRAEDPETKVPKGFGFAEYADAEGVTRAIRLLNNLKVGCPVAASGLPHQTIGLSASQPAWLLDSGGSKQTTLGSMWIRSMAPCVGCGSHS